MMSGHGRSAPTDLLNDDQRRARAIVGLASLGAALLAAQRAGVLGTVAAAGAGWFGISHLVAARTGYAGCPELGAIPSIVLRREIQVGCTPWRVLDHRLRLTESRLAPDQRAPRR